MIPPTVPPFPFYIINKDIIKGSFPFRKTFLTPKLDFEARFRNPIHTAPRVPPTRRAATEPRKRNKSEARESFPVRRTLQSEEYSIFAPEGFGTKFQTLPSGPSESPLLSPFRHRYCQVNPPAERLKKHARQHLQSSYFSR